MNRRTFFSAVAAAVAAPAALLAAKSQSEPAVPAKPIKGRPVVLFWNTREGRYDVLIRDPLSWQIEQTQLTNNAMRIVVKVSGIHQAKI